MEGKRRAWSEEESFEGKRRAWKGRGELGREDLTWVYPDILLASAQSLKGTLAGALVGGGAGLG